MLKFDNSHIFTGYLKQKLSSVNIPACKIYTREYADYFTTHGEEDPRVVESTDTIVYKEDDKQLATRINYLRGNEVYNYYNNSGLARKPRKGWQKANMLYFDKDKITPGLTKTLHSPGPNYDKATHEYLGEYLRFLRDYQGVNLMSMYNCFNNTLCNNISFTFTHKNRSITFSSYDKKYKIYAFPVKLFANYTIAIDCYQGVEICCGLYNTHLYSPSTSDKHEKEKQLGNKTYLKIDKASFSQPVLYSLLASDNWKREAELKPIGDGSGLLQLDTSVVTRWEVLNHEQDLKMFIKVPASCRSTIVVLEGDYRTYNNARFAPNLVKNLDMSGCALGNRCQVFAETSKSIIGYRLSNVQFGYYYTDSSNVLPLTSSPDGKPIPEDEKEVSTKIKLFAPSSSIYQQPKEHEEDPDLLPFMPAPDKDLIWQQDDFKIPEYSKESGYCEITNGAELAYVIKNNGKTLVTVDGKEIVVRNYKLMNDIFLNDPSKVNWKTGELLDQEYTIRNWFSSTTPSTDEGFVGSIDGNYHTVYGLFFASTFSGVDYSGLIPVIKCDDRTIVKNLVINYAYIRSSYSTAFVGGTTLPKTDYDIWTYEQNHSVVNFYCEEHKKLKKDIKNTTSGFKPIGKLQLLAFNNEESHPFADRLIEYLCDSAITPFDEISDNIKRAQRVMKQNLHHFRIDGLWEDQMQKIIYDYIVNSGPVEVEGDKLVDKRKGYHRTLGHTSKSNLYDILGYVDKDAEKWYSSVRLLKNGKVVRDTIQNVDIYDGLYDL